MAVDERGDDLRVRGRAPDTQSLELLHETRLGEARRRLSEVLRRRDLTHRNQLALLEHRERLLILERAMIPFLVRLAIQHEEALELDHAAGRPEQIRMRRLR